MKQFIGFIVVGVIGFGVGYYIGYDAGFERATNTQEEPNTQEQIKKHEAPEVGITFEYREDPNGYVLEQPNDVSEHQDFVKVFVLMLKKDYEELQQSTDAREGPPTINIAVFENSQNKEAHTWAQENQNESNIHLLLGSVEETTLAEESAIRYKADGLYALDTVVVSNGNYMYVITGAYLNEDSQIRKDFQPFLDAIRFDS